MADYLCVLTKGQINAIINTLYASIPQKDHEQLVKDSINRLMAAVDAEIELPVQRYVSALEVASKYAATQDHSMTWKLSKVLNELRRL